MRALTTMCTLAALLAGAAASCHSHNQSMSTTRNAEPNPENGALEGVPKYRQNDVLFMRQVAMAGMTEVELGRLAADKGATQEVRDFGRLMADQHAAAGEELARIARSEGVTLPIALDSEHRAIVNRLARLSGAAFDEQFTAIMVSDHQDVIAMFERETQRGTIPAVTQFAQQTLPTLRSHLQMAHQTQALASAEER